MNALTVWITAARPKTLAASISPVLLGMTLALAEGSFHPGLFLCTLFTALGIQVSTNLANDYFDFLKGADTVRRKGPTRVTQAGLVSLSQMKRAIALSLGITACLGLYLALQGGVVVALLLFVSLALSILYTGGPYPLAYLGLGDLFVFLFFGPVAVTGTYFLQTNSLSSLPVLVGIGAGALSTAILVINNLRDQEEDAHANKKTLIVRFGMRFGRLEYLFCLALASLIPCLFYKTNPFALLSLLFLIPASSCIKTVWKTEDPQALNLLLPQTGLLLSLYTVLLCIGWIL